MPRPLTPAQLEAIEHPAPRLQVLACAGSGKTEVLARRAARLLVGGTAPSALIAFTFTEKAAAELKARIESRAAEAEPRFADLPPVGQGMFIGTTHGWALQMLRELGGIYEMMDPLTEEQEWVLLHRVARRLGVVNLYAALADKPSEKVAAAQAIEVFLRSVEVVHNDLVGHTILADRSPDFAGVLDRYEWLLREMRVMPFRLMISHAVRELTLDGRLRAALAGKISHVLVDEFQDFNPAQDRLLGYLVELGAAVTVVADDDQAIYQWRGGDVKLFTTFAERFHETEQLALPQNHRSRPEIVAFAQELLKPIGGRLDKPLRSEREPAPSGAVEIFEAPTVVEEARGIAHRIRDLMAQGHPARDVAVLFRSVRTSARPLVDELRQQDVPCAVVGKTSLLARPEMALVARLFVYWAGGTWYPNPDFTPEAVTGELLRAEIERVTGTRGNALDRVMGILERLGRRVKEEGVRDSVTVFNEVLATLGLPGAGDEAKWRELGLGRMSELLTAFDNAARRAAPAALYTTTTPAQADEATEDVSLAADRAEEQPRRLGATRGEVYLMRMRAFLEEFAGRAAEETPDTSPGAADAVQIMTVHQSKGLEFPIVFVPCLVEGRFPTSRMGQRQASYVPDDLFDRARYEGREEDEARLLYVALTRAKELLVVSWFEQHPQKRAKPSRFLTRYLVSALSDGRPFGAASPVPTPAVVHTDPLDADFSSLVTYSECHYRYWLRHVCGFQPPLVPELGFGTLLHHLVAELARQGLRGVRPRESDVETLLAESFYLPFAGPIPAEKLREAARRRVKGYVRHYGDELIRTVRPEVRFEVPLGNARLRGRIDLMVRAQGQNPNQVDLVDFKTSANRPPSKVHMNQLRLYAAAAERQGYEPTGLWIHDLDSDDDPRGDRIAVPHDDNERTRFVETLEGWVEGIRGQKFDPVAELKVCRRCDFRRFCAHAPAEARA